MTKKKNFAVGQFWEMDSPDTIFKVVCIAHLVSKKNENIWIFCKWYDGDYFLENEYCLIPFDDFGQMICQDLFSCMDMGREWKITKRIKNIDKNRTLT